MIINLTKPKEIVFGTQEYFDLIEKTEGDMMKAKDLKSSIRHHCDVKHFVKNEEPTEEDLIRIDKECVCNNGKLHVVCPNGHATETQFSLSVMKSCKKCTEIMNHYSATFESESMRKKREADKIENDRYQAVQKQIKERREQSEVERQARILARAEILKEEIRNAKKEE